LTELVLAQPTEQGYDGQNLERIVRQASAHKVALRFTRDGNTIKYGATLGIIRE
jgi:hypothetical protein